VTALRQGLVFPPIDALADPQAGATWLLTQLGPCHHLNLDEVMAVAAAGSLRADVSPSR
jgi:hypothetical protein